MSNTLPPISPDPALASVPVQAPPSPQNAWKALEEATPDLVRDASQQLEYKAGEILNGR